MNIFPLVHNQQSPFYSSGSSVQAMVLPTMPGSLHLHEHTQDNNLSSRVKMADVEAAGNIASLERQDWRTVNAQLT